MKKLCFYLSLPLLMTACFEVNTIVASNGKSTAPQALTADDTYLYVADPNTHTVYKVTLADGTVTAIAGTSGTSGNTNGTGTGALFNTPSGLALSGGMLYVADASNHRIRKIDLSDNSVTTFAGSTQGAVDAVGTAAKFKRPYGLATDDTYLYVADLANHLIRRIEIASATVTTLAGSSSGTDDGIGTAAKFSSPTDLIHISGLLYISDRGNHTLRALDLSDTAVTTWIGVAGDSGEANGAAAVTRLNAPYGLATDGSYLLIADFGNDQVRRVSLTSKVSERLLGALGDSQDLGDGGNASDAKSHNPGGIAYRSGKIYFSNHQHIRKME